MVSRQGRLVVVPPSDHDLGSHTDSVVPDTLDPDLALCTDSVGSELEIEAGMAGLGAVLSLETGPGYWDWDIGPAHDLDLDTGTEGADSGSG